MGRNHGPFGSGTALCNPTVTDSDQKIVELVSAIATERGVSQAQITAAWLRRHPVVAAPIVGALKTNHIDDMVGFLAITLTDDEAARLEAPYTPRRENQGVSNPAILFLAAEAVSGFEASAT